MIEEFFVATYYNGDYRLIDYEANKYEDCVAFVNEWAEQKVAESSKEVYNEMVEQDKHFCYWNIEKRFRLKGIK